MRYAYCTDEGFCFQRVGATKRPTGALRLVPWQALSKVEARLDDSICIETTYAQPRSGRVKRYLLKPVLDPSSIPAGSSFLGFKQRGEGAKRDPACVAWLWAQNFSLLASLLGSEVTTAARVGEWS